jgi:hypothetical protein
MLYWNNLQDDLFYVIDLVQWPGGFRGLRFRIAGDPAHEYTALETEPRLGRELKALGRERRLSWNVPTTDGRLFWLDPHDIWMTIEEAEYWEANHSPTALEDPEAPWVNKIPPRFAPA